MINSTYANPVFISQLVEYYYGNLINNNDLYKKLSYSILNNPKYDDLFRDFLRNNNRAVPNNVKIRVSAGGSSQCIIAFYYAIYKIKGRNITVGSTVTPPYYILHKELCKMCGFATWVNDNNIPVDIEVNVSPNNFDGRIQPPSNRGEYVLLDAIYDFYNFTGNEKTVNPWVNWNNNFIMTNSLSKFGFAGARIGAILSTNNDIISYVENYMSNSTLGTNTFAIETLKNIIKEIKLDSEINHEIYNILQYRLKIIREIIPKNLIKSNKKIPFLFVKLNYEFFEELGIEVRHGSEFDVSNKYSRIELLLSEEDFNKMIKRLKIKLFKL